MAPGQHKQALQWYWCLKHERVEQGTQCEAARRLGPYDSPEAAQNWRDRVETRNERWDRDDERWEGSSA